MSDMDHETAERNYLTALDYLNLLFGQSVLGNLVVVEKLTADRWRHKHFDAISQRDDLTDILDRAE
jgi:hypothetical protein